MMSLKLCRLISDVIPTYNDNRSKIFVKSLETASINTKSKPLLTNVMCAILTNTWLLCVRVVHCC